MRVGAYALIIVAYLLLANGMRRVISLSLIPTGVSGRRRRRSYIMLYTLH